MIKIEKNVPIKKMKKESKYPFEKMDIGDSFEVEFNNVRERVKFYELAKRKGISITVRKTSDKTIRIWRVK